MSNNLLAMKMTSVTDLLVSLGAYMMGTLVRLAIIAAFTPFGGYHSGYTDGAMTKYFSSLTADLPLMASGIVAGFLCARFTTQRDFGWASVPASIYLLNSGLALFRDQSFEMWLIMTGLPSLYAAILCVGVAYWVTHRQLTVGLWSRSETK